MLEWIRVKSEGAIWRAVSALREDWWFGFALWVWGVKVAGITVMTYAGWDAGASFEYGMAMSCWKMTGAVRVALWLWAAIRRGLGVLQGRAK